MGEEKKTDRVVLGVVGCFGVFFLALVGTVVALFVWVLPRGRHTEPAAASTVEAAPGSAASPPSVAAPPPTQEPGPTPQPASSTAAPTPRAEPAAEPRVGFAGSLEWERPVEAADLTAVDVGALFVQARVVAEKLQPGAQFTGIVAFETTRGKVDLTGEARVVYKFEFVGLDPNQPPGKDSIERAIDVTAQRRVLRGSRRDWPASQLKAFGGPMDPPTCTSADAWATGTNSGVPDNAVATLHYYDSTPFKPGGPWVWSIRVDGHDEHRREIDGKTCALLRNWNPSPVTPGKSASAPSASPQSPVAPTSEGCSVHVNSIPVSSITLDGRPLGTTPRLSVPVSCGTHTVVFTHREKGRKSVSFHAVAGKPALVATRF